MEYTKKFLLGIKNIPEESINKLLNIATFEKYKKNHLVIEKGKTPTHFYILKNGLVRSFYTDDNFKEYTRTLISSNSILSSLSDLFFKKPSKLNYECLTACEVYKFDYNKFKVLTNNDINIAQLYITLLENGFQLFENKIFNLSVLNATERYLVLKKEIPNIDNLIPQYYIASYLNISAVQLSRIRKEIYTN